MITSLYAPMKKDSGTGKSGSYDFRRQARTDDAEPFVIVALMALCIRLSHDERKPFTPGSMVLGVVKLTTSEAPIIDSLNINFKGLTKVFLNQHYGDLVVSKTDYVSEGYLFSRHLDLYSGDCIQHKGTYAWPFVFRIPLFAAPRNVTPGSKEMFYPKHPWKCDLGLDAHPLPPSMVQTGGFVCSVQYVLEATLVQRPPTTNHPKIKGKEVRASQKISVQNLDMPSRIVSGGDWPYFIHRHTMPLSSSESSHRSVHRLLPIFSRKGLDPSSEAKLCFSVLLPKKLEIKEQQALSIAVSCTVDGPPAAQGSVSSAVDRRPDLVVYSFKLSLVQHTQVRAGSHANSADKRVLTRKGSGIMPVSRTNISTSQTTRNTPIPFVNLCDTVDLSVPAGLLAADFSTYNIARHHSLEVLFRMTYERKTHKFVLRNVPLRVVPQSTGDLQRRLSEGVEEDDVYGCDLTGIQWRDHTGSASEVTREVGETLQAAIEGHGRGGEVIPGTPLPAYTA
ncbi:hypothetical protein LTR11_011844 [Exophiala xenobiotica]|nr:hypothetical protein LTR11_011844 [Exophiala xenobiotica]